MVIHCTVYALTIAILRREVDGLYCVTYSKWIAAEANVEAARDACERCGLVLLHTRRVSLFARSRSFGEHELMLYCSTVVYIIFLAFGLVCDVPVLILCCEYCLSLCIII